MKTRFLLIITLIFLSLVFACTYQGYWLHNLYSKQFAQMEVDIMTAMRNADDQSISWKNGKRQVAGFSTYNDLLQSELILKGINIPSFTEIFDLETQEVTHVIPADTSTIRRTDYRSFVFPFDIKGKYAYRLNIKKPEYFIVRQMSGIIATSLLLVILLFFTYFYLLKLIFRQKSLDEIKSDFINNMTHELKTPISVAYAANDALLNYNMKNDKEKLEKYLRISQEQLQHLSGLVEQILTMSAEERKNLKLSPENIPLNTFLEALKEQYLMKASKKTEITIDIRPEDLSVRADKVHFQNIISNLLENASKYSGESVDILVSASKQGERIRISIQDNGNGIPAASLPRIFDKFYRVPSGNVHNVKGYGLGLSYIKTIMEKHGGSISVESKEGEGSCFYLNFPV